MGVVRSIHRVSGLVVLAMLCLVLISVIGARVRRREIDGLARGLVVAALAALGVQGVLGVAALPGAAARPPGLHFVYGVLPAVVLALSVALAGALERDRWVPLSVGTLVALALALRAFDTGSG